MPQYLFVYGTLRRRSRHPMARRLAQSASHVGAAKIAGRLFDLGRYPGLKEPTSGFDWVQGDVYDLGVDAARTLQEMDAYENAESPPPTPYERLHAAVTLEDGRELTAWVYWYRGNVRDEWFIASGSYEVNCEPA
jgi:gamma-glutamylcyclotransferase (GGCT)/AIG2-like uncharacterized protein YtfP